MWWDVDKDSILFAYHNNSVNREIETVKKSNREGKFIKMKVFAIGLLICLVCLYLMIGGIALVVGGYGFPIGVIVCIIGLFLKWDE